MDYMSTDFGADSSAVFLLERGQTDATERPTACVWVIISKVK